MLSLCWSCNKNTNVGNTSASADIRVQYVSDKETSELLASAFTENKNLISQIDPGIVMDNVDFSKAFI